MKELQQFIETINKAMPDAWDAAVRQVYMLGTLYGIITMVCGGIVIWIWAYLNREETKKGNYKYSEPDCIAFLIACAFGIAAVVSMWFTLTHFINPQYQAIELLKP